MAEPFLGDIALFGFNFPPRGWAQCDGQILPINQNQSLYSLLGTTYGGDGRTTFALPDLRGRTPMHFGTGAGLTSRSQGQKFGSETTTLTEAQIPSHSHTALASTATADAAAPLGKLPAPVAPGFNVYGDANNLVAGKAGQVISNGGAVPHNNMQPSLTVNFCIALSGLFPSRN